MSIPSKSSVCSQVALAIGCVATIAAAVHFGRPLPSQAESVAARVTQHPSVDSAALRAPWLYQPADVALRSSRFLLDRELFAMDLLRTGHVTLARARALADVAVRQAYERRVPPALVLGVMLTENDQLKSSARSSVGAVGLMQVYPKHWAGALGRKFGTNLRVDSTNLKYGIFILGWVSRRAAHATADRDLAWRKALLGYNGCVKGTNTPTCHSYPDAVRRQVEENARGSCPGADFDRCVIEPMWLAQREDQRPVTVSAEVAAKDAPAQAP